MTASQFRRSLNSPEPPTGIGPEATALWFAMRRNWSRAHDLVQIIQSPLASWLHAALHKMEGDDFNAQYWYDQADLSNPNVSIDTEFEMILHKLLESESGEH